MEEYLRLDGIFEQGYGFIAKKVMKDQTLLLASKGLYAYLCSYSGKGNDVFPSRKTICNDLQINNNTLSKYLNQLVKLGYIEIASVRDKGKFCKNIYKIPCIIKPYTEKSYMEKPYMKNPYSNNNSINNNNIYNNNIYIKEYEKEIGLLTPYQLERLNSYLDDLSEEMIIEAIHIASRQNKKSLAYIEAILKNWINNGIKTVADIKNKKDKKEIKLNTSMDLEDLYDN